jgi:hypothetical protein
MKKDETDLLDPELVASFESPEAINDALRAIVDAAQLVKPAKAKARRPQRSTWLTRPRRPSL